MSWFSILAFDGVGLEVFWVAWIALAVLIAALLAAAANVFFRSIGRFDDELRAATMDLEPAARRRFYELYDSRHPKSAAVAWFLAVAFGPVGANLYRARWGPFLLAVVSLNGLGAWWLESWFTAPQLVALTNRSYIDWAHFVLQTERAAARGPERVPEFSTL